MEKLQGKWYRTWGYQHNLHFYGNVDPLECIFMAPLVLVPNFRGLSGSADRGGDDNSIQIINFGRVSDKSFEEWRQNVEGWKGG